MFYDPQLALLTAALQKCRIQSLVLTEAKYADPHLDMGLRRSLKADAEYAAFFGTRFSAAQHNTIYQLADSFHCHYLFLRFPEEDRLLFIGPYLKEELSQNRLLELAEHTQLTPQQIRRLESFYSGVPVISDYHAVFAMLDAFGEILWGSEEAFTVVDINREQSGTLSPLVEQIDPDDTLQNMELLELRYAYENELIQAVSQGLTHKAELMLAGFSQSAFEQRLTDPIRNLKNYGIIMNTLLRKAAEAGGVHPLYLDRTSTDFARRIELTSSAGDTRELMASMFRTYCRLVKTHALKQYSPPIQKVIALIDADPAGDLNLSTLAKTQGLNASYLSALFRRETGETITAHITRKRMQLAMHLLSTTRLQVQTVAQHCGIHDINYFSKLFRKTCGKTPREYRASLSRS